MDSEVFDSMFEKHWQEVYVSALKRLRNAEKATDITQEAFFQLWLNKNRIAEIDVIDFLLTAVKIEIFSLRKKEHFSIAIPPGKLFDENFLPGAN